MKKLLEKKPTLGDLKDGLRGLSRIEETYDLNAIDISEGRLLAKQFK